VPRSPAYVLGGGLVTALGRGAATHARALAQGVAQPRPSPVSFMGQPLAFHFAADPGEEGASFRRMAETAVADALAEAALPAATVARMGLFVGSTCLDLPLHEAAYTAEAARGVVPAVKEPGYGNLARDLAVRFGIRGPQYTLNTACSSSANAALYARAMLAAGRIEHALVVGAEGYTRLSLLGFAGLMLLSRTRYRPFDRARDGLVLGEGVGALVLGRQPPPGAGPAFRIAGGASACDPSSPTGSSPERIAEVMREALADAGRSPADVAAIKAHGTGTPANDAAEARALAEVFAARPPPLTSIKPCLGHTLGACGAIELLALRACWQEDFLPPTPGFETPDEMAPVTPLTRPAPLGDGAVLCNFIGFGGNNTSLLLARGPAR
jgi:3-oxoacyl-[acyl-carrier-protein] synthase I